MKKIFFSLDIVSTAIVCPKCICFIFFRKLRTVMINWEQDFDSSNTVNRVRPILLIARMITHQNGVHLVLLPLCLTEVAYKALCIFP